MEISILGNGEYADVLDLGDGTVVKAYLRKQHTGKSVDHWPSHEAFIRALFANEVAAYERLKAQPDLERFVPRYFGHHNPRFSSGSDEQKYVSGCGLRLEKLSGLCH